MLLPGASAEPRMPALARRAADAGVRLESADRADARGDADRADGAGRLAMQVSADIQGLLALEAEPAARRVRRDHRAAAAAPHVSTAVRSATAVLDGRMAEVRHWLSGAPTRARLQSRGLTTEDVEVQLHRRHAAVLRLLQDHAQSGMSLYPLVPSAHLIFSQAVRDASAAMPDRPRPTTRPTTTTSTTTVTAAPAAQAPTAAPNPYLDLARQERAIRSLDQFQIHYVKALPQIAQRRLHGLWDFVQGDIQFQDPMHMAASFPCAISITGGTPPTPLRATYPAGEARGTHVRQAFVRGRPAVVARSPDSGNVRISTDGYTWQTTPFYTDDVVEATKLEVWRNVLAAGDTVYQHVVQSSLWGH